MATLQEVLGNRTEMDENLRERHIRAFDAMSPEQQRAAYVHQARVLHEVTYALQLARDGHTTFRSDKNLLEYITALVWSTDGAETAPAVPLPTVSSQPAVCPGCNQPAGRAAELGWANVEHYICEVCGHPVAV
jgi:hypothetical protein